MRCRLWLSRLCVASEAIADYCIPHSHSALVVVSLSVVREKIMFLKATYVNVLALILLALVRSAYLIDFSNVLQRNPVDVKRSEGKLINRR